jgi:hypothetical protein
MVMPRFLVYLVPRLSQLLGWPVDTRSFAEPLLQKEVGIPQRLSSEPMTKGQQKGYHPPSYNPPNIPKVSS